MTDLLLLRGRQPQSPTTARPLLPAQGSPAPTSAPGSRQHLGRKTCPPGDCQSAPDMCEPSLLPDAVLSMAKRECDKSLDSEMKKKQKTDDTSRPLACPFFIAAPEQFMSRRTCAGHSWNGIHRLKEHLYRHHDSSRLSCERCLQTFADDKELVAHRRRPEPCNRAEINSGDAMLLAIGPKAMNRIRSRRGTAGKSDRDKWYEIWDILFPDIPRPESPYTSPTNCSAPEAKVIAEIRPHLEDQLIGAFRTAIKNAVADERQLTSINIKRVVSNCVDQAVRRYLGGAGPYHGQMQRRVPTGSVSEFAAGSSVTPRLEANPALDWYSVPSPATSGDPLTQLDTFPCTITPELFAGQDEDVLSHSAGSVTSGGIASSDGALTPIGDFGLAQWVRISASSRDSIPFELSAFPQHPSGFETQDQQPLDWPMEFPAFAFTGGSY